MSRYALAVWERLTTTGIAHELGISFASLSLFTSIFLSLTVLLFDIGQGVDKCERGWPEVNVCNVLLGSARSHGMHVSLNAAYMWC